MEWKIGDKTRFGTITELLPDGRIVTDRHRQGSFTKEALMDVGMSPQHSAMLSASIFEEIETRLKSIEKRLRVLENPYRSDDEETFC